MKIAILLFGQPRFFSITKDLIRDEFDLPGHEVHFFAHFWNKIGYVPEGDEEEYDKEKLYVEIRESLPNSVLTPKPTSKNISIQDYTALNEFTNYVSYFATKVHGRKLPIGKNKTYLRYKFGQHWSMRTCFNKIRMYEKQNNFKYDIIIKVRTDIIYKSIKMYPSKEDYYNDKLDYYTNIPFDKPSVKCIALRFVDLTEKSQGGDQGYNEYLTEFYDNKFKASKDSHTWLQYVDSNYYLRPALNDWSLIANREAAEIMFGSWFENYFMTLSKDIRNNKTSSSFISESDHSLQGQFLLNYNLHAKRIHDRRDVRLLHPDIIKEETDTTGKILAHSKKQVLSDLHEKYKI
jgi:hypothetical protein